MDSLWILSPCHALGTRALQVLMSSLLLSRYSARRSTAMPPPWSIARVQKSKKVKSRDDVEVLSQPGSCLAVAGFRLMLLGSAAGIAQEGTPGSPTEDAQTIQARQIEVSTEQAGGDPAGTHELETGWRASAAGQRPSAEKAGEHDCKSLDSSNSCERRAGSC